MTTAIALDFATHKPSSKSVGDFAESRPDDIHLIAGRIHQMSLDYYRDVQLQEHRSFILALILQALAFVFISAAAFFYHKADGDISYLTGLAGIFTQLVTILAFRLYARTARQFAAFHICLERTNRFLLANSLCESLMTDELKDAKRTVLIDSVVNAPALTIDWMDARAKDATGRN